LKISVITVCYNSAATLEETIQSVLAQDHSDVEYIIVDGASTDGTADILAKYQNQIHKVISEPDKGIYDAMNKGLALATGDVVAILNSDDLYADVHVLSRVAKEFEKGKWDCLCTDISIFKETTDNIIRRYSCTRWKPWMFRIGHQPPHPGFFVKQKCYSQHGEFNTDYRTAADFDLMLRFIYKHKLPTQYLPMTTVLMRSGGESQRGIKAMAKANLEDHQSLKRNGYFSLYPFIWLKYLIKVFQLF